eukprot:TRINITY_DN1125_c0_g1_i1.p1 TRINITY_DN1125_c0_g1~~TRINITY_DN1125_c0_g1_i1.p1  ORF type:complete len:296 (+),score=67.04 TRINITY_DN1125_c0_g1_i1:74-889(+)
MDNATKGVSEPRKYEYKADGEPKKYEETHIKGRPVRVFADGVYDLFHSGHARSLRQAKTLFENAYLIVGVSSDKDTHKLKGKTVMNENERAEGVSHCKWVDEVIIGSPWVLTPEFIEEHKIDYVVHGEDLSVDEHGNDVYDWLKKNGKFKTIKRTEGISTSDIILRILKDYDSYVRRNLKRGYTGKELGISKVKETSIKAEENIEKIKHTVNDGIHNVLDFVKRYSKWEVIKDQARHVRDWYQGEGHKTEEEGHKTTEEDADHTYRKKTNL